MGSPQNSRSCVPKRLCARLFRCPSQPLPRTGRRLNYNRIAHVGIVAQFVPSVYTAKFGRLPVALRFKQRK